MLGAMPRLFWNWSKRVNPCKASRRIRMLHHSPTRSRLRAIGHCIVPKLLRCIDRTYARDYYDASLLLGSNERRGMSVPSSEAVVEPHRRSFWMAVICGAVILTIGMGARQSFGIFQKPIAADLHVGRELWSFAIALSMLLMGAFSPFVGNLADRFGTARTVAAGGVLYVAGMFMIAFATEGVMLTLGNVLCGIGMAAAGFGPIFGSISRQTPPEKRSVALGVTTAGGSFGQFAIVPFVSLLQSRLDNWHTTMFIVGVASMGMVPLAFGVREQA